MWCGGRQKAHRPARTTGTWTSSFLPICTRAATVSTITHISAAACCRIADATGQLLSSCALKTKGARDATSSQLLNRALAPYAKPRSPSTSRREYLSKIICRSGVAAPLPSADLTAAPRAASPILYPLPPSPSIGPIPPTRCLCACGEATPRPMLPVPLMTTMPHRMPSVPLQSAATESFSTTTLADGYTAAHACLQNAPSSSVSQPAIDKTMHATAASPIAPSCASSSASATACHNAATAGSAPTLFLFEGPANPRPTNVPVAPTSSFTRQITAAVFVPPPSTPMQTAICAVKDSRQE